MKFAVRLLALLLIVLIGGSVSAHAATLTVPAGGDLQAALYAAQPGDTIELAKAAVYVGEFTFPAKAGNVTLTTAGTLPTRRIAPSDAPVLARIRSPYGSMALNFYNSANWTVRGIAFDRNVAGAGEVIGIWDADRIVLDQLLFDIPDPQEQKRFVLGNGTNITMTRSYCSGVWWSVGDSQCFVAFDGAGPYTLTDNFLEAASENVMFGGADSRDQSRIPCDIRVEGNTFTKRAIWKAFAYPSGPGRGVKNLFELKSACRVVVQSNLFDGNWSDSQAGRAIVFTPRNQDGTASWSGVTDVAFTKNVIRNVEVGISIAGYDGDGVAPKPSMQTTRVAITNNDITTTSGQAFLLMDEIGVLDISSNRMTVPDGGAVMTLTKGEGLIRPTGSTVPRLSAYAVHDFTFAANTYNGYIHSALALGELALKTYSVNLTLDLSTSPTPTPTPTPTPDPEPVPIVSEAQQRIDAAIADLTPMLNTLSGKALTKLKDAITRLRTLKGMVQ